jgi:transposase
MAAPTTVNLEGNGVLLKTILNRVQKYPGFVYLVFRLLGEVGNLRLEIDVEPHKASRGICSGCGRRRPGYDRLRARRFEFVPLWGIPVYFIYAMRRVECRACGIRVEVVPWAEGKSHLTKTYAWFLAGWAKRMSWSDVAAAFRTTWENVFRSVEMAVKWGRQHRSLDGIESLGIDELYWSRKNQFLTLVYQIDEGSRRLLWIGKERKLKTLMGFFRWFGPKRSQALRFICSDMWKPYLRVIAKKAGQAIHVLDRFHIASHLSKAIDEIRAKEAKDLRARGRQPLLTRTRWLLLKRPENLTPQQEIGLAELLRHNLRAVRAYLLKEDIQRFWTYVSPYWAGVFLDRWCARVMRSRLEPMKKVARMLRRHRPLILNWFRARGQLSAGAVEGLNGKARVITKRAYGFRTYRAVEVALYHGLGRLPEPDFTHRFC